MGVQLTHKMYMTASMGTTKSKMRIAERIEVYLDKVARGFDRKRMNAPKDIFIQVKEIPEEWIYVGMIPRPKTRLQRFLYHMIHGLAMGYPFHRVIAFSLIHTKPKAK